MIYLLISKYLDLHLVSHITILFLDIIDLFQHYSQQIFHQE